MLFNFNSLLTDEDTIKHAEKVKNNDNNEEITYYIDNNIGWNYIDRYYNSNTEWIIKKKDIRTFSIGHNNQAKDEIRNIFKRIDKIIDLDFKEMSNNDDSEIDIYGINYSSNMEENAIGAAISQHSNSGAWWDILWKKTDSSITLNDSDKNTLVHEIGHVLGLSHPNNDPFNKKWDTQDTVMSYNKGENEWNTWFSKDDINALISLWKREDDLGYMNFDQNSSEYKFYKSADIYSIKSDIGLENITNIETINFADKNLSFIHDIKEVFNQLAGIDHITGKIYRLYNAAFGRFPDTTGFKYWINNYNSKLDTYRQISHAFIESKEFINLYGEESSNDNYINKLYLNILNRSPDEIGKSYWMNQLNLGLETRGEILMGFSESQENISIFSEETGLIQ